MSEGISIWILVWIAGLAGMVIGVLLTLWLRRLPEARQLKQQLDELRQCINESQKTTATQEQIEHIREGLNKTHESILRVSEGIQSLLFAQQTLHPEITHQLQDIQKNLAQSLADIRNVQEGLSQVRILTSLEKAVERIEASVGELAITMLGRRSGQVGERIVEKLLSPLPDEWMERDARLGNGRVEFALKLPGGYLVPLDSKFVSPEITRSLAHDTESGERQQHQALQQKINDLVKRRAQEIANYLVDERAMGFGIAAVPDAAYEACRSAIQTAAQRHQIVIVPYSLLLPYTMSLYLMAQRLGITQIGEKERAISTAQTALQEAKRLLENMQQEVTSVANLREKALKQVERALECFAKEEILSS